MRKLALACALCACACAGAAHAQVSMYGVVDMALVHESGGRTVRNRLSSGVASGSRLGFRGTEDLGGGRAAIFVLESGFRADTGEAGQRGKLFDRQSYLGLRTPAGTVTMGLQLTPQYLAMAAADPFDTGMAGDTENLMGFAARMENSIKYASPVMHGMDMELAYATGGAAADGRRHSERGAAIGYAAGGLTLRLGYHERGNTRGARPQAGNTRNALLSAVYDFGAVKSHFAFGVDRGPESTPAYNAANPFGYEVAPRPSSDSKVVMVGLSVPQGAGKWMASYIRKTDRSGRDQGAAQLAFGYRYQLSPRTDVYAAYGRMRNRNGAGYAVGNATNQGMGDRATQLGLRHVF